MAIAVYVRVSTIGQNVEGQRREIQRWLDGNGITDAQWYTDKASGATMQRDDFERLQAAMFAGEVQTVVVWRLDRLSRSLRDGVNILGDWCERGVRVVSVTQQLDLSGDRAGRWPPCCSVWGRWNGRRSGNVRRRGSLWRRIRASTRAGKTGRRRRRPTREAELRRRGLNDTEIAAALGVSRRTVQRYLRTAAH